MVWVPIGERFRTVAERVPRRIAIVEGDAELSYGELDAASAALARRISPGHEPARGFVGLLFESKLAAIPAIIGAARCGRAYVPLDAGDPDERLRLILRDSEPVALLTEGNLAERARALVPPSCAVIDVSRTDRGALGPLPEVDAGALANIYYTSGSTGAPKGVCQTQRNVLFFADAYAKTLQVCETDRLSLLYTLSFSASMMDIFGALLNGATLCAYDVRREGVAALVPWLESARISVLHTVPTVFRELCSSLAPGHRLEHLRAIDLGGETVFESDAELFRRHACEGCFLVNHLAATEANVIAQYVVDLQGPQRAEGILPVGRSPQGLGVTIARDDGSDAATGEVGNIVVSSKHLSPGYWRRPELNAAVFSEDPREPGGRRYVTGDLGRIDRQGNLHFLGRSGSRIKIRGQSIDPTEVEAALATCPGIVKAAVVAVGDGPDSDPDKLVAYLVAAEGANRDPIAIRRLISARLPRYMLPASFLFVRELPLTASGKIDRSALCAIPRPGVDPARMLDPPRGALERAVARLFEQFLRQAPIGRDEDFFMLGGDSLSAIQLLHEISTVFGVALRVDTLYRDCATIAAIARQIESGRAGSNTNAGAPTIPRRAPQAPVPLTATQERVWFLQRLDPGSSAYHEPRLWTIDGDLDVDALRAAIAVVAERQSILRTRFAMVAAEPRQQIDVDPVIAFEIVDLTGSDAEEETRLAEAVAEHVRRPFALASAPPLRWTLFRLGPKRFALLRVWHHILGDAWSAQILQNELSAAYAAVRAGRESALPGLPVEYADYAVWQAEQHAAARLEFHLDFWRKRLAELPILGLRTDFRRPSAQSFRGDVIATTLPHDAATALRALGREQGATPFATFLAAFAALLSRISGDVDLAIGTPVAGRDLPELDSLIGFFANTLVLRTDLRDGPSAEQLIARTRDTVREALLHQDVPLKALVDALGVPRDPSRNPLFQVAFALREHDAVDLRFDGAEVRRVEARSESAKFDLTLTLIERSGRVDASWEYCTDLFERSTIERISRQYARLVAAMAEQPTRPVATLPLMDEPTRQRIAAAASRVSGERRRATSIARRFAEQVRATPRAPAIGPLDYAALDAGANRLGRELHARGVRPGSVVAVARAGCAETAVAWLAVIKAGAAYLPIDPNLPRQRIAFMVGDARVAHAIADEDFASLFAGTGASVIRPERDAERVAGRSGEPFDVDAGADADAYVIYTSGSTGSPKGVVIPQRAVVSLVCGTDCAQLGPEDAVAQIANPAFDASTFEFWGALLNGARLVPIAKPSVVAPRTFAAKLASERVTALFVTTALFNAVARDAPDAFRSCRYVLFGGEAVEPRWVAEVLRAGPPRHLIHVYGPTETTTFATWHEVADVASNAATIPIGRPLAETEVFVLRSDFDLAAPGEPGELCIGGPRLALGYLNASRDLAGRFVERDVGHLPARRLYLSGDQARLRDDGAIEFLGRRDRQVKIRGHRIELEEVEAAIASLPQVSAAAVSVRGETTDSRRLVAYVVRAKPSDTAHDNLWRELRSILPQYMLPASIVWIPSLPLNANGKLDRRALSAIGEPGPQRASGLVPPRDMLEQVLARIWESVLDVRTIGVFDHFFEMGGHSLLAARLVDEIERETGIAVPLAALFADDTISGLARLLRERPGRPEAPIMAINEGGGMPPLVFLHGDLNGGAFYSRSLAHGLGADQPVLVVHPHGFDGAPIPETIEEMAADRIAALRAYRPKGPYVLGGYCNGALVAFEMARQLIIEGERVPVVVMIEVPALTGNRGADPTAADERYVTIGPDGQLRVLAQNDRQTHYAQAIERYAGGHYAGHLVIVRSHVLDAIQPEVGWRRMAASIELHVVSGDHNTLVTRYIGEVASVVRAAIDRTVEHLDS